MKKVIVLVLLSSLALFACPHGKNCEGACLNKDEVPKICPKKVKCHSDTEATCQCATKCECEGKSSCDCKDDCTCTKCKAKK